MQLVYRLPVIAIFLLLPQAGPLLADDITWLVEYEAKQTPSEPTWSTIGEPVATIVDDGLHLKDDSQSGDGCFRAAWKPASDQEIVVDATLKVGQTTGVFTKTKPGSISVWPWRDGAPVALLVSDGQHQDGLVFYAGRVTTFTDRSIILDAAQEFHTYRLVIRGTDMSVAVDGKLLVRGQGAFQRPAPTAEPFIQFGSNAKTPTGDAVWKSVRLGVRKPSLPASELPVKVTLSEPWLIVHPTLKGHKPTRPYVYNIGGGRLLMSLAEGPDAIHEPYGLMMSTDEGRTWSVVQDLDQTPYAPLPMARMKDGSVVGPSRWTWVQPDKSLLGRTVRWGKDLAEFEMVESRLTLPPEYSSERVPLTCERQLFEQDDGSLLMAAYSKTGPSTPEGLRCGRRYSHLLRSTDRGQTWAHYTVMGPGGEPAVAKTGAATMTALLRTGPFLPLVQVFSEDHGRTWSPPVLLEEGSVCPDLVMMTGGLLASSYGRPANMLMFSPDGGKNWTSHHLITDRTGFNYSGIVEVRPGRLLYVHDAGGLQALYVDVEQSAPAAKPSAAKSRLEPAPASTPAAAAAKPRKVRVTATIGKSVTPDEVITYKTVENGKLPLTLNVFKPAGWLPTDKRPVLVTFHGGGWAAGDPSTQYYMADRLAKRGWVGISVKYRLTNKHHPGTTPFDAVKDARSAVRYVRAHGAELGINSDKLVVNGGSAGGHLAAATALFDDVNDEADDLKISTMPQLMVLFYPVIDTGPAGYGNQLVGENWKTISPVDRVVRGLPPTLLLHGDRDTVTPYAGAKLFHERMIAAGNACELITGKGGHGYFTYEQASLDQALAQVDRWLKEQGYP